MKPSTYRFPGLWFFVERAAGSRLVHHLGWARDIWHFRQVQESLSQACRLDDREMQRKLVAYALRVRESLAVTLKGIDEAISEVAEKFDLYDKEKQS